MIASSWRKAVTLVLLASASLFVPGAAQALPPTITEVEVYGNTTPDHPDADEVNGSDTVFANSAPYGPFTYQDGLVFFRGMASPGVKIEITVREEPDDPTTPTITHLVTTKTESQGNPGFFSGEIGNCNGPTCIQVQDLGTHKASVTDSSNPDPATWGPTVLRFGFTAVNSLGEKSAETVSTITKYAGTPLDNSAPEFRGTKGVSELWCHNSRLFSADFRTPISIQGNPVGASITAFCNSADHAREESTVFTTGDGVCPDFMWVSVANLRVRGCSFTEASIGTFGSKQTACICGSVIDNPKSSYNVASEIDEVTVTITGGTLTAPRVYKPALDRGGSQAAFGVTLSINDFEPTWPPELTGLDPYHVVVEAKDAWGKTVSYSQDFDVAPF